MAPLTKDGRDTLPGGLTPAQSLAFLEGWAARVPLPTITDEAARGERRRAQQAALVAKLIADPALVPLKATVAALRRQVLLCEHQIAVIEYDITVLRRTLPANLDDVPQHHANIEQREREVPLLHGRLAELRQQYRTAVDATWRVLMQPYHRRLAEARARLETTKAAAKALVAVAEADFRAAIAAEDDLTHWV